MQRRIGTHRSVTVITHWKHADVDEENPVRALMEVERRSPTPMRAALTAVLLALAGLILIMPPDTLQGSLGSTIISNALVWISGISIASLMIVYRLVVPFILNKRYRAVKRLVNWLEKRRYKMRR